MGMSFGSWSNPLKKVADTATGIYEDNSSIDLDPRTADITIPDYGTPNIPTAPNVNIPDSSHATSMLTTGLTRLGEGIDYGVGGVGRIINRNLHELAKLGKEAMTGKGGYSDDESDDDPAAPGPTGFEAATAQKTLLTGQRSKGKGRQYHAGSGSASNIG